MDDSSPTLENIN